MSYFDRNHKSYGNKNFGRRNFGARGSDRQMYKAICSNCGKDCRVPFRPTGSKPVFCSDCFEKNNAGARPRRSNFDSRNSDRPQNSEQFNALNAKLDKILAILESALLPKKPENKLLPAKPSNP